MDAGGDHQVVDAGINLAPGGVGHVGVAPRKRQVIGEPVPQTQLQQKVQPQAVLVGEGGRAEAHAGPVQHAPAAEGGLEGGGNEENHVEVALYAGSLGVDGHAAGVDVGVTDARRELHRVRGIRFKQGRDIELRGLGQVAPADDADGAVADLQDLGFAAGRQARHEHHDDAEAFQHPPR